MIALRPCAEMDSWNDERRGVSGVSPTWTWSSRGLRDPRTSGCRPDARLRRYAARRSRGDTAGDHRSALGVDLLEPRQQTLMVRDLDRQSGPGVGFEQHRAFPGVDHDVHAQVTQANGLGDAA